MKVAIFENQYNQVKIQFEVANKIFFDDKLQYHQFNSSQELQPIERVKEFDLVIIDISLSSNSDKDGFDLIEEILKLEKRPPLLILTGNSGIQEGLTKRNLPSIPILMKPVDPLDIKAKLEEVFKS